MRKMVLISVVTASLLTAVSANEDKSVPQILNSTLKQVEAIAKSALEENVTQKKEVKKESSVAPKAPTIKKETTKIDIKVSSIGEDKSVGDIIKASLGSSKTEAKVESKKDKTEAKETKVEAKKENKVESKKSETKTEVKKSEVKKVSLDKNSTNAPFDYKLKPKKVADDVWCFFGALDKPTKENAGNMANNCYVKTNDGYFLMDTGPSYQFAKQAYSAMKKIADLPVKYVVNSHNHDDHWLGNDFYKKEFNATLIGPETINTNYKEGDKTRMYNVLPKNAIEGTHIIKLDKTPKKPFTLSFGGKEFKIIPMAVKAHTVDDIFVYMPKEKVLFAGDLVMNGRITSNRDGSVMGQIKAIDMIDKLDWKVLVPGHGLITGKHAVDEARLYFKLLKERIMKALDEDVDATEITEKVTLPEFKDKAMYDILNAQNVGYAFDELEMLDDE